MSTGLAGVLASLAGPLVKKALAAIGIGVVSYAAVQAAFSAAQSALLAAYGQAPAGMMWVVERAGFTAAIGILLGALAAKFGLLALGKMGRIVA